MTSVNGRLGRNTGLSLLRIGSARWATALIDYAEGRRLLGEGKLGAVEQGGVRMVVLFMGPCWSGG